MVASLDGSCQPEVGDLDVATIAEQHVLGLDVAVHEAGGVGRREAFEHGGEDLQGSGQWQPGTERELLAQRPSRHVFHDQVHSVCAATAVEDGHHMGIGQPSRRSCLGDEPIGESRLVDQVVIHHLHGNDPFEP